MKILAFSDTHNSISSLRRLVSRANKNDIDVVLCAGDISIFGNGLHKMMDMLSKIKKPVLMVHGNHEFEEEIINSSKHHKNIINIHKKIHNIENYLFIGWGGGGFSFRDQGLEKFIKKHKSKLHNQNIILITHAPPYGTKIDNVNRQHCGNKTVANFIRQFHPIIAVSGHLHETEGKRDKLGKTIIANPGYKGMVFNIEKI